MSLLWQLFFGFVGMWLMAIGGLTWALWASVKAQTKAVEVALRAKAEGFSVR